MPISDTAAVFVNLKFKTFLLVRKPLSLKSLLDKRFLFNFLNYNYSYCLKAKSSKVISSCLGICVWRAGVASKKDFELKKD